MTAPDPTPAGPARSLTEPEERARRRAEVFGDVLPESTSDDRDTGSSSAGGGTDEWLRSNVPPHHG